MGIESIVENRKVVVKKAKKKVLQRYDNRMVKRKSDKLGTKIRKKKKLERGIRLHCLAILRKLMFHRDGLVFNKPVDDDDPHVVLNMPDYFSVISAPMDLGTIRSKLRRNTYSCADEFAADVRLTFSNAMLYYPPSHDVHKTAIKLNQIFEMRWKAFEEKFKSRFYNKAFLSSFSALSL